MANERRARAGGGPADAQSSSFGGSLRSTSVVLTLTGWPFSLASALQLEVLVAAIFRQAALAGGFARFGFQALEGLFALFLQHRVG